MQNSVKNIEEIIDALRGTSFHQEAQNMKLFYDCVDMQIGEFTSSNNIHCIKGCGTCCEHFIPDLTTHEAKYLAIYLISEGRVEEALSRFREDRSYCPFYDHDKEHHCSVYPARGLICRLFGSVCSEDKNGMIHFPHCKWNESQRIEMIKEHSESYPTYSRYGIELESMDGNSTYTEFLPEAVEKAIHKLEMILNYLDNQAV